MKDEVLTQLLKDRTDKRAVVLATRMKTGEQHLIYPEENIDPAFAEFVMSAVQSDKSQTVEIDGEEWFLNVSNPPLRLIIIGGAHIAQNLAPAAKLAGYDVTVVDPRTAFASEERFPGIALSHDWPDEAMEKLAPDHRTGVITLTHDTKLDDPALHVALKSPAFYIGCLGSKKTHAKRVERLTEIGFTEEEIGRLHATLGLAIGSKSPAEIAISALAQMTSVLRGGTVR